MKVFNINDKISIVCEWKKTRTAFKHEATLMFNGIEQEKTKICYLNRTWESYEYQSVMFQLIRKSNVLTAEEKQLCNEYIKNYRDGSADSLFKMVGLVAKMGDVLCQNQKEKNDWKLRMIKAGLENKGLIMPEDWDTLDEETKQQRLDNIISLCNKPLINNENQNN